MNTKRRAIRGLAILTAATGLVAAGGCAKSPTVVNVTVDVDATVPSVLLLHSTITLPGAPQTGTINKIVSPYEGDGGLAAPFVFPMLFPVAVPAGWAGEVVITIDGVDWHDDTTVLATGMTSATATREQTTVAAVTLTAVATGGTGGGDGGALTDAASTDGGPPGDAGSPDAAD